MKIPALLTLLTLLAFPAQAFPPAPNHVFYGMVRDEMGNPLDVRHAEVILETANGSPVRASLVPGLVSGVNYRLAVPMDSGATPDIYRNTALRAGMLFKLRIRIGQTVYIPIEMFGEFHKLGGPAQMTRLDLTLGEDLNGNGIPDAWERAQIEAAGGGLTDTDLHADEWLASWREFLAGAAVFDIEDGFSLRVVEMKAGAMVMEFMSIPGRTYTVFASSDLTDWEQAPFRLAGESASLPDLWSLQAVETKVVQVSVSPPPEQPAFRFFKLRAE